MANRPNAHYDQNYPCCQKGSLLDVGLTTTSSTPLLFENIVTKEEITQYKQFLLLPQCFPILVIGLLSKYRDFLFFDKICSMSSAAELPYQGKG